MSRNLPPLNSLVALEATLRHGSVRRAAIELGVTSAAVSQHVRQMEERYEVELLVRRSRGLELTEEGRRLLPGLTRALDELDEATRPLERPLPVEPLRVSMLPSFANGWFLPRLLERNLGGAFELSLLTSRRLVDFERDEVDFAIRYGKTPPADLASRFLFDEEIFPVAAPNFAMKGSLSLEEIRELPLLHDADAEPHQPSISWDHWFREAGLVPPRTSGLRFSDSSVLFEAAASGLGIALGRGPLVAHYLRRGQLVRISSELRRSDRGYYLVGPKRHFRRPRFRAFLDWILEG